MKRRSTVGGRISCGAAKQGSGHAPNAVLERYIQHLLPRPVGRPPKKPVVRYHQFMYQAGTWEHERRVVAKVEWHQGELFPRVGFIVTNLSWQCKRIVRFYSQRDMAEVGTSYCFLHNRTCHASV